jgi:F420H(2)-dependent quinone reductase
MTDTTVTKLTRQERFDYQVMRRFPRLGVRGNRVAHRLSGGRIGGSKRGVPIGLLTTVGRRSGKRRTVPLMYMQDGDRFLVVASNAGLDVPPAWYLNLQRDAEAIFRPRDESIPVLGRELSDAEQREVWGRMTSHNPLWAAFQDCTARRTAVIALEPAPQSQR